MTQHDLSSGDLLAVETSRAVEPRPAAAASFPGLLRLLASEWDGLMVETYELRQQLDGARQELSHALYQHDAACRVIARVTKERDEARAQAQAAGGGPAKRGAEAGGDDGEAPAAKRARGRLAEVEAAVEAKAAELQAWRKKRPLPEGLPDAEAFAGFDGEMAKPLHKTTAPGVRCVVCEAGADGDAITLSGGEDGQAVLFDADAGKIAATLKGHKGAVSAAALSEGAAAAFTGGADGTLRLWGATGKGGKWKQVASASAHEGGVAALSVHPCGEAVLSAGADGWALFDAKSLEELKRVPSSGGAVTAATFHPDGLLVLLGGADGKLRIVELKSLSEAAVLDAHDGAISAVTVSANGYHVATAGPEGVKVWDLRKQKLVATLDVGGAASDAAFDKSGLFLAAAGTGTTKVFGAKKKWAELKAWGTAAAACAFHPAARFLACGAAGDRHLTLRSAVQQ